MAALVTGLAVLIALSVLRPPPAPTVPVVVVTADLVAGHQLRAQDVTTRHFPAGLPAQDALGDPAQVIGRSLVGPVAVGTALGSSSLVTTRAQGRGRMLVPLRVDDAGVVALLRVGDLITVSTMDESNNPLVLARRVRVAALPRPTEGGVLSGGSTSAATLVVVDVDDQTATRLSLWASSPTLGVALG